jgi:4-oxalomesaconate tautomerase
VQTPGRRVSYEGTAAVHGVPGTAAPVLLNFRNVAGGKTGALLPTGRRRELIDGIEISCVDAAMPMMLAAASSFGLTGGESAEFFLTNDDLMRRIEAMRRIAGRIMGLGDVRDTVVPKVGLLSPAVSGGTLRSRYLTPHSLHAAHAVTGGICVATAACLPGTVAHDFAEDLGAASRTVAIEHPSGTLEIRLEIDGDDAAFTVRKAGVVRTARKIMSGHVYVDESDWTGG